MADEVEAGHAHGDDPGHGHSDGGANGGAHAHGRGRPALGGRGTPTPEGGSKCGQALRLALRLVPLVQVAAAAREGGVPGLGTPARHAARVLRRDTTEEHVTRADLGPSYETVIVAQEKGRD
jgi:hypothetical protein